MNLAQLLLRTARVRPDAPAVCHGERVIADYRGLAAAAARIARHLLEVERRRITKVRVRRRKDATATAEQ